MDDWTYYSQWPHREMFKDPQLFQGMFCVPLDRLANDYVIICKVIIVCD